MEAQKFLLITDRPHNEWYDVLKQAVAPYGELDILSSYQNLAAQIQAAEYILIFIDAASDQSLDEDFILHLVQKVKKLAPETQVIITTSSPTWKRAVASFHAGAKDYIKQFMDKNILQKTIEESIPVYILEHNKEENIKP
jgi:DNA-binding NtrC family response regulator